jgi:succinate dehydrogenase / fumarate reductase flavoprotein subunit
MQLLLGKYHKKELFANPCYTQIHPTCIPVSGDQSKLTLMSESRNDGRIWVPAKLEDAQAIREGKKNQQIVSEAERDYYLERRYPAFGNLVPRDIASRAKKDVMLDLELTKQAKRFICLLLQLNVTEKSRRM